MFNREKGITLIALAITIIILLILVGITIATLTGENGLLNKATTAVNKNNESAAKERLNIELLDIKTEKLSKGESVSLANLDEKLDELTEKGIEVSSEGTPRKVTLDGYSFNVKEDLTIEGEGTSNSGTTSGGNNNNDNVNSDVSELLSKTNHQLTVEDVLTSETYINSILENTDNIDYIITNKDKYMNSILNSSVAMKALAKNEYAMEKIINDSEWTNEILNSQIAIQELDNSNPIKVPIMTSNTTPSGTAFASSEYTGYPAYKAFDGNSSNYWGVGAGLSYKDQYVGYDFVNPIWVYKIEARVSNGKQDTDYVIEASNDKNTWKIIKSDLHQSSSQQTIIPDNYNGKYRYYRLRMLSEVAQSGSGNTIIPMLQFYGK